MPPCLAALGQLSSNCHLPFLPAFLPSPIGAIYLFTPRRRSLIGLLAPPFTRAIDTGSQPRRRGEKKL